MEALHDINNELITALAPLVDAAQDPQRLSDLLADLGWTPNSIPQPLLEMADSGAELVNMIGSDPDSVSPEQVFSAIKRLIDAINAIHNRPDADFPSGIDIAAFKNTIARDLLDYLIVEHLLRNRQQLGAVLKLTGIVRLVNTAAVGLRKPYLKREAAWNRLGSLITDPAKGFREVFDWNSGAPKLTQAVGDMIGLLDSYGLRLSYFKPNGDLLTFLNADAVVPLDEPVGVELAFDDTLGAPEGIAAGIQLLLLPATASRGPAIAFLPYAHLNGTKEVALSDTLSLTIGGSADFSRGIAIILPPGTPPEVKADFLGGVTVNPPEVKLGLKVKPAPGQSEQRLFGAEEATRLAINGTGVAIGSRLVSAGKLDVFAEVQVDQAHIVIKPTPDEADSFLASLLGKEGISAELSFALRLSSLTGFSFAGSGGLEASFPLHLMLGPIELQALSLGLKPYAQGVDLVADATISGKLGPLAMVIERAGFKLAAQFPDPPTGNLGPIDVRFGFKPPKGIGLAIDAGVVKGGGYLYFDFDKEEYAGALELTVSEFLSLKAIGFITTRMPDGSEVFSLLIIVTAEFGSPIQLSFGFTLSGVGGLLGLHRTMHLQPLSEGIRTGAVNSVMFPTNVIENAPRIISDLRTFFPPYRDIFLIGPMAKIGWGTPNLVTLSLGIIIEIPGNIAILGVLKVALPDEEEKLLVLQVNFIGAIEFDKKRAWFFASMFESRVLFMTIEGEMGVLVCWGDNANFVVSVGGFHPAFNPPPLPFPEPKRIAISILNTSFAKIRVEGYFAVTSNTVQFGASAELYFGVSAFDIDGHITFDALFQFSPFYLIISISASLSVKVFGVGLFSVRMRGSLEGPTPWHVEGTGSISLLFFDIDVDFSHTWGEEADTTLPPIEVMPLLKAEYEKLENWKAEIPAANSVLVSLRKIQTTDDLVLHPVGTLKISQRTVPLDITINKVGAQKPRDANYFTLLVGGAVGLGIEEKDEVKEMFAMAQFKDMADSKKLSSPAYEKQKGGLELSVKGEQMKTTNAVKRVVRYEQIIIDSNFKRFVKPFFTFYSTLFDLFLKGNAITKSTLSNKYKKQKTPFDDKIAVTPNVYVVSFNTDNSPFNDESKGFNSYAQAEEFMNRQVKYNPNLQDKLHVIPKVEMKGAA